MSEELTYGSYLALGELLAVQRPRTAHPDELLFIIVHQASELWFKLILHELDALYMHMNGNDAFAAIAAMKRINALVHIVTAQLTALETLPPQHFAQFRGNLGTSSGSQSAQFRAIEAASGSRDPHFLHVLAEHGGVPEEAQRWLDRPTLEQLFERMVSGSGATLASIYQSTQFAPLQMLSEALLEYEQGFGMWRFLHVQLVERIIGPDTGGTGGTLGARYLQHTLSQRFFPKLWEVRAQFY